MAIVATDLSATRCAISLWRVATTFVLAALLNRAAPSIADSVEVSVGFDQRTTVVGHFGSLRALIEDICYRADVRLLAYDVPDRAIVVGYRDLPLTEALAGLLRGESYFVTLDHHSEAGASRVKSLRVMGDNATAQANRTRYFTTAPVKRRGWELPPLLVRTAFSSDDPDEQRQALELVSRRMLANELELGEFLSTDAALIAEALARYPKAAGLLAGMRDLHDDERIRVKLSEIIDELERR